MPQMKSTKVQNPRCSEGIRASTHCSSDMSCCIPHCGQTFLILHLLASIRRRELKQPHGRPCGIIYACATARMHAHTTNRWVGPRMSSLDVPVSRFSSNADVSAKSATCTSYPTCTYIHDDVYIHICGRGQ